MKYTKEALAAGREFIVVQPHEHSDQLRVHLIKDGQQRIFCVSASDKPQDIEDLMFEQAFEAYVTFAPFELCDRILAMREQWPDLSAEERELKDFTQFPGLKVELDKRYPLNELTQAPEPT